MGSLLYVSPRSRAYTSGAALGNSTTPTSLLPSHAKADAFAPGAFGLGRILRVTACGRVSNIVTTPGTLTLDLRLGATVVANGGAMALNIVAKTNVSWTLWWLLTCFADGSTANLMHQGAWTSESVIGSPLPSAGGAGVHLLPNNAPAVGSNFDATAALALDLFATWSIANAGNTITLHQAVIEVVN